MKLRTTSWAVYLCLALWLAVSGPAVVIADMATPQFEAISLLIERADAAQEQGRVEEAIRLYGATLAAYRDFMQRHPDYQTELVQFRISYCRHQLMGLLAAQRATTHAAASKAQLPEGVAQSVSDAIQLCREGRFPDAEANMRDLLEAHPDTPSALLVLATALMGQGKTEEAKTWLQQAIELDDPGSGAAHYNMAQLLVRGENPDFAKALDHYRQALDRGAVADPNLETVLNY